MEDASDGEGPDAPLLSVGGAGGAEDASRASPPASAFDPNAPVFVPGKRAELGREADGGGEASVDAAAAVKGPSLVFSGGGDFLSKYRNQQREQEATKPRQRRGGGEAAPRGAAAAPDRVNVQLNSMLVHARHHDKILQVVDGHFDHFNAVNLITALHRLATVVLAARKGALRRDARFKRLIHRLTDTLRSAEAGALKPQDLSNVAWALTKLGLLNAVLFGNLSDHIMKTIHNFEPVNLSMTLWAFARSGFLDERLFRAAATEVKRQLPDFQPQQIANTTWAMAKSGFVDEEVFFSAADLALQKLQHFQPMNYSMLLYSFALAKLPHPKLFEEVGQRCTVEALSSALSAPHVVTNLALAFSDAGVVNDAVFGAIAQVASTSLHDFRTQQISTLTQAFARAEVRHERLFNRISAAVVARLAEFKQQDLQELLDAYQSLGVSTADIARAIEAQQTGEKQDGPNVWLIMLSLLVSILVLLMVFRWRQGG